ncbi:Intradiol ring-cleavage dioxygenase [Cercophora newfieldiana]|uniref:Intradiol ring-cleavage dioxygenase n=1 Tax=Cercophora newfieldiana TaxID=92897 RepID=A0AA40CLP5_9PEZI|nr:Intradiol ring-cleavage dioxygenase [Cercophora newfieldiana]
MRFVTFLAGVLATTGVFAHPGHDIAQEIAERKAGLQMVSHRSLDHCTEVIKRSGLEARLVARRNELADRLIKKRGLVGKTHLFTAQKRADPINTSHKFSYNWNLDTPASVIFASNRSCILSPEVTEGPYYLTGEYIREDLVENQAGVDLYMDILVLDTKTCKPVPNVYVEIWQTNSTGVYGGVIAQGNGNFADKTNNKKSWLRGAQKTTEDGVVSFGTLFPGHYTGRTTHTHVMVHPNAVALANGTIKDTTASHVGQFFFDQDLITLVEKQSPYSTNKQALTTNAKDGILQQSSKSGDPFINYIYLNGKDVMGGLLGWISFGIDTSLTKTVRPAGQFTGH